ncbi:Programmed cell death protein 6 [Gryganskiella cystojenkinii]|nr:Programmed cell death protein 6 [Gryganskiella cystojenkinii]
MAYNQYQGGYNQQQHQQPYGQQQQHYGQQQQQQQFSAAYQSPGPQHSQAPYGSPYQASPAPQYQQAVQYQQQQQQQHQQHQVAQQSPEASLRAWFDSVDADRSGSLNIEELQRALINGDWSPFNVETVRLVFNMFDSDNSGLINFDEFKGLWKYIEEWRACFVAFDKDRSGFIDFNELKTAMHSFRYNLSDNFLTLVIRKYDKRGRGDISFDMFIQISCSIKSLTDAFMRIDREGKGYATIGYEQFLELVINNR